MRCPQTNTTLRGPVPMAVYSARCSQGVAASAVAPKLVGPAAAAMHSSCWWSLQVRTTMSWCAEGRRQVRAGRWAWFDAQKGGTGDWATGRRRTTFQVMQDNT